MVPQKNVLILELTCAQTVRLFCILKGVDASRVEQEVDQLLLDVGLVEKRGAIGHDAKRRDEAETAAHTRTCGKF